MDILTARILLGIVGFIIAWLVCVGFASETTYGVKDAFITGSIVFGVIIACVVVIVGIVYLVVHAFPPVT